ncbi:HpcH/HpaI aldolase/citrate lyase family protein [Caproiciproducens galactitolivorans]|uniref:HpcH/HpaI aldolase family protein n=1 Tax=Caproiciproducens galactitolivorans TaxID=642589 RepID=UPI00240A60EB|nr:aldolase/citrate lyase family protein [Caproiciproducens galactitolivorans]
MDQMKAIHTEKQRMIGTFFELGGCNAIECLAGTGLDYVIIDTEHGNFTPEDVCNYIRTAENGGLLPYVRIGSIQRPYVLQMLDIGAKGIIVPNITSVEQVKELISYAKFPPLGNRGYCPNRTTRWGSCDPSQSIDEYMADCNLHCKLIPQCETVEALEQIEEITALDGVDGIFVGPCDLSISMGIPLQFNAPALNAAIERILKVCKANRKMATIFAGNSADANRWFAKGFDSVTCGLDTSVFINAYKELVNDCKENQF